MQDSFPLLEQNIKRLSRKDYIDENKLCDGWEFVRTRSARSNVPIPVVVEFYVYLLSANGGVGGGWCSVTRILLLALHFT